MLLAGCKQLYPKNYIFVVWGFYAVSNIFFSQINDPTSLKILFVASSLKMRKEVENIRSPLPFGVFLKKDGK